MAPAPPPSLPTAAASPLPASIPRQLLLLAGWAALWAAVQAALDGLATAPTARLMVFLAGLGALALVLALAAPDWSRRLLVSVTFAVTQGGVLAGAALLGLLARRSGALPAGWPFQSLPFAGLLALLAASALAITWQRRPYPWSRVGFLLTHVAPTVVLAGLLLGGLPGGAGPGLALARTGLALLLAGAAWMFYLKPVLKRREAVAGERRP